MTDTQPIIPPAGPKFRLGDYGPRYRGSERKGAARKEMVGLRDRLNDLQNVLFADRSHALLVILQGIDTAGKDSTINSVFQKVGPLGSTVHNFGVPHAEELAHDYLWRYHIRCPERGRVVIFNRSYYEAVLVERVKHIAPKEEWKRRYEDINEFERYLSRQGTVIMKFFLHISKEEQRARLQERVDNPRKQWKFNYQDLAERKLWDDYQQAFEEMVEQCSTDIAPWHVVPADRKWYRDVAIARALVEKLESLDLRYPPAEEEILGTVVE